MGRQAAGQLHDAPRDARVIDDHRDRPGLLGPHQRQDGGRAGIAVVNRHALIQEQADGDNKRLINTSRKGSITDTS